MNIKFTDQLNIKPFVRAILVALIVGFCWPACSKHTDEKTVSGAINADAEGKVLFMYSVLKGSLPEDYKSCAFTTNLPAPNDRFTIVVSVEPSTGDAIFASLSFPTGKREIEGLTVGQKVTWTATAKGTPLNHGSGHFVHIINE